MKKMERLGNWSTEKWEADQMRMQINYERAEAQLQRTQVLQERYREQMEKLKKLKFFENN